MVADSSYIVERLVEKRGELGEETVLAPDLVVPEVVNAILVQQRTLHLLKDGTPYIEALFGAVDAAALLLVEVTKPLAREAYEIAMRSGEAVDDCIYIALALRQGAELKTLDHRQARVLAGELDRRNGRGEGLVRSRDT